MAEQVGKDGAVGTAKLVASSIKGSMASMCCSSRAKPRVYKPRKQAAPAAAAVPNAAPVVPAAKQRISRFGPQITEAEERATNRLIVGALAEEARERARTMLNVRQGAEWADQEEQRRQAARNREIAQTLHQQNIREQRLGTLRPLQGRSHSGYGSSQEGGRRTRKRVYKKTRSTHKRRHRR